MPGKNAALSASCGTDAALGDLPLIYPFLVNDPGEGAQAKRRAHATIVDHLVPPMARAEAYGDIARLEQLLDEYSNIAAMDPAKLPAVRGEIWTLMKAAELHRDLGLDERPDDEDFDDFILHVDGWLCEIKDAQIRDGLHVPGEAPIGEARVNLVLAILRAARSLGRGRQCRPRPPRGPGSRRRRRRHGGGRGCLRGPGPRSGRADGEVGLGPGRRDRSP
ncbi:cobaltochelatase subunit CobN [Nocardioides sp. B-3]|uniref:cobaltochelatase subunit CobN n=1 Tax=Nocardioides sp. B-3 TaxID=2895565 RepID=UPI002152105F|nr:cobaltochelatase subunit CobN [Nocardioides sp. B-3]UUZ61738.1 cobaltochelatase subunit CobN [Nocardioides sp. B-3]